MSSEPALPRLTLRGIRKVYPAVVANDGIDLTVMPGEIHAVLGENGAGKSTLMKIVCGVVHATAGEMIWEGQPVSIDSPAQARALGIGMVFQHFSLFETLTVVENIALSFPAVQNLATLAGRIDEVASQYGLPVNPRRLVHELSVGERQRVEIVRCLLQNPRLLIMDEPTSVLTPQAVLSLFETLRQLAAQGCSILYVSHKLDEVHDLCHRATVLRGGKVTATCRPAGETPASMARMMIGHDLPVCHRDQPTRPGESRLCIDGLSLASEEPFGVDLKDIHLDLHAGEIVGIAGISGNGQQELLAALVGEKPLPSTSMIRLLGVAAGRLSPRARRRLGLCLVPEERLGRGAVPEMSLAENGLLTAHGQGLTRFGLVRTAEMHSFARHCIDHFRVKCGGTRAPARSLSGGNLQKFIVGREISLGPKVLIIAQPTWGVDVGASTFIHQTLIDLAAAGTAVLVISEELEELFRISDRLAVLANGRLSPTAVTADTSMEEIGLWMSGLWQDRMEPMGGLTHAV